MQPTTAQKRYRTAARAAAALVGVAATTGAVELNAAICLLACAGALFVLSGRPSPRLMLAARAAAAGVALYALATLSGSVADLAGDSAPAAAAGFALVGAALAGLDARRSAAPIAAGCVAAPAFVALVSSTGSDEVAALALDLLFLSVGVLLARPEREPVRGLARDTPGGAVLRRLLPFVLGAPLLLSAVSPRGGPLPAAILLALGLLLVWVFAREIDAADERLRRVAGDAAAEAQLPKSVV